MRGALLTQELNTTFGVLETLTLLQRD